MTRLAHQIRQERQPLALVVRVNPARGGKIVSLLDTDGVEWLTTSENAATYPGLPFGDAEMAGWDECAPTITACTVEGRALPDHGDIWDVPWTKVGDELTVAGRYWPYVLSRRISPISGGVRIDYRARATGRDDLPFLWAAHPQFAAPSGTHVELHGVTRVVDVLHEDRPQLAWSPSLASLDGLAPGGCRKVYVDPGEHANGARLVRPDGRALRMTWSSTCPYLGLWFDNEAWAREPVIAIEPSTAFADSLEAALLAGTAASLSRAKALTWWLELRVERL